MTTAWHEKAFEAARALLAHKGGGAAAARAILEAVEREVSADPDACFTFDATGAATLRVAGNTWAAGRFTTPTLGELEHRVSARKAPGSPAPTFRLTVLHGQSPLNDIGMLQAVASEGTLFQAASQFNCLESPGARPSRIQDYPGDPTQGPRASVSAFPGTFLRHYAAPGPDDTRFVQNNHRQLDLLADAFDSTVARVRHGYLTSDDIHDPTALAAALQTRFNHIRVGLHAAVEVVLGHNWSGPVPLFPAQRIAQVFTSTIALGMYSHDNGTPEIATIRRHLLRAAYLGTLLATLDLGHKAAVLTLIGGGVFANPHPEIWEAILWAITRAESLAAHPIEVIVNGREFPGESGPLRKKVLAAFQTRPGTLVDLNDPMEPSR